MLVRRRTNAESDRQRKEGANTCFAILEKRLFTSRERRFCTDIQTPAITTTIPQSHENQAFKKSKQASGRVCLFYQGLLEEIVVPGSILYVHDAVQYTHRD